LSDDVTDVLGAEKESSSLYMICFLEVQRKGRNLSEVG
jgi:hypothetical protein